MGAETILMSREEKRRGRAVQAESIVYRLNIESAQSRNSCRGSNKCLEMNTQDSSSVWGSGMAALTLGTEPLVRTNLELAAVFTSVLTN